MHVRKLVNYILYFFQNSLETEFLIQPNKSLSLKFQKMHTGDGPERCHCYYFADEDTRVNHADAQAICKGKGG